MELCRHFPRKIMSHATVKRHKASDAVSQSESAGLLPGGKCSGLCLPIAAIACKAPVKTGNVSINNTGPFPKQKSLRTQQNVRSSDHIRSIPRVFLARVSCVLTEYHSISPASLPLPLHIPPYSGKAAGTL